MTLATFSSIILASIGIVLIVRTLTLLNHRRSIDVLNDLLNDIDDLGDVRHDLSKNQKSLDLELLEAGLRTLSEQKLFKAKQKLIIISTVTCAVIVTGLILSQPLQKLIIVSLVSLSLSYIVTRRMILARKESYRNSFDFSLPLVMERLVMAVSAGFDVVAAIQKLIELEQDHLDNQKLDPITTLLQEAYELSVHGMPFQDALKQVSLPIENPAVRHAFIYLGRCYEEGGELIRPLRELSENTQLYYQERIEESVARLPVKATLPLLCTFIGLILLFMTTPLIQVIELAENATTTLEAPSSE